MLESETSSSSSDSIISEEESDNDDLEGFSSEEDKITIKMVVALNQLSSNTIKMLLRFQKEVFKCIAFNHQEDLNIIINLIRSYFSKRKIQLKAFDENLKKIQQIIVEIKEKLDLWLLEAQQKTNVDHFFKILNDENILNNGDEELSCEEWTNQQLKVSTLNIDSNKMQLDKTNTLLFVSKDNKIKLYGFNNYSKKIKTLMQMQGYIEDLLWLNKSNQLLSIGYRKEIILWKKNWQPKQIVKFESKQIKRIIASDQDDLITGGFKYINFWKKINSSWECSQTIDVSVTVTDISFNLQQTKLISSGQQNENDDNQNDSRGFLSHIYIIELQNGKWVKTQTFNTSHLDYDRLFFTGNNSIVLLSRYFGTLETFNFEHQTQQLIQTQLFQFSDLSRWHYNTCQYIQQTKILVTNQNYFVYFFILDQNGKNEIKNRIKSYKLFKCNVFSQRELSNNTKLLGQIYLSIEDEKYTLKQYINESFTNCVFQNISYIYVISQPFI